jgi:hypothetical protein
MTDEFGFEVGPSSEVYEGHLDEMLDRLELQESSAFESPFSGEWESPSTLRPAVRRPASADPALIARAQKHKDAYARLMRAVEAMKKHVTVRDGRLHFFLPVRSAAEGAASLGIDHRLFNHLYNSLKLRSMHHHRLQPRPAMGGGATVSREVQMESDSSCAGVTKVETVWWGVRLWLDECNTQKLLAAIPKGAAAVSALCAAVGGEAKIVCPVFSLIAAVEAPLIDWTDTSGGKQGVVLSWTWAQIMPGTGVTPIVVSQSNA